MSIQPGDSRDMRLCRQVEEQLQLFLGEIDDERLDGLSFLEVFPVGGIKTLLVQVYAYDAADIEPLDELLQELLVEMREEVATAISRKRTPNLRIRVQLTPRAS